MARPSVGYLFYLVTRPRLPPRMHWLRHCIVQRTLVVLLLAGMGTLLAGTAGHSHRPTDAYANWVRAQLALPADGAVEAALQAAADEGAVSLHAFLQAFATAYEAQEIAQPLAHLFGAQTGSTAALITYLHGRYARVVGEAVLPRLVATTSLTQSVSETRTLFGVLSAAYRAEGPTHPAVAAVSAPARLVPVPIRLLSAARPLGP